jgi:hypothetical protein
MSEKKDYVLTGRDGIIGRFPSLGAAKTAARDSAHGRPLRWKPTESVYGVPFRAPAKEHDMRRYFPERLSGWKANEPVAAIYSDDDFTIYPTRRA